MATSSPMHAWAVPVIGLCLPRADVPHLAAVSRSFAAACEDPCFWRRLWCVLPDGSDSDCCSGARPEARQPLASCARHTRACQELRLTSWLEYFALGAPLPGLDRLSPALSAAVVGGNLLVLTLERSLGVCADPIFGTAFEQRRQALEAGKDVFAALAAAFGPASSGCRLRRLKVCRGSFSAASFERFLRAARPPLEAVEFESALLHGRNYPHLVTALREAHPCPERLSEFATNEYVGGEDPLALLASAFPGLRTLRVRRLFGARPFQLETLRQSLPKLRPRLCRFPRSREKLYGGFKLSAEGGCVDWFITSDHHDDDYRGAGLSWTGLNNNCECMFDWKVGGGVTREQLLEFMRECGIEHQQRIADEIEVSDIQDIELEYEVGSRVRLVDMYSEGESDCDADGDGADDDIEDED